MMKDAKVQSEKSRIIQLIHFKSFIVQSIKQRASNSETFIVTLFLPEFYLWLAI